MTFEEWEKAVPRAITDDSVWRVKGYRLALFAPDIGWHDVTALFKDRRMCGLADQLYRALGSISANIEEGYGRGTGKDRARFYEYALGSARESRGWYYKGRHVLSQDVVHHRMRLLTEIIKLLLTMVPEQRGNAIHEERAEYHITPEYLLNVPLP